MPHFCTFSFTTVTGGMFDHTSLSVAPNALAPQWRANHHADSFGASRVVAAGVWYIHQDFLHLLSLPGKADIPLHQAISVCHHLCARKVPLAWPASTNKNITTHKHKWVWVVDELQPNDAIGLTWRQLQLNFACHHPCIAITLPCAWYRVGATISIDRLPDGQPQNLGHTHVQYGLVAARVKHR